MRLYLVQHGVAKPKEEDPERPLTPEGREEVRKVADRLEPLGLRIRVIWHSGKKRAQQTAELLAEALAPELGIRARGDLGPTDSVDMLAASLGAETTDTMIVGHLPFLSKLASLLLVEDEHAPIISFRNGGVVCLRHREETGWEIEWILTPDIIA